MEKPSIEVRMDSAKAVTPILYGWHYEEIGMIGEGGLYAEMIRNRGLEEANPPGGLTVKDGIYADIPNPGGENKKVYDPDPLTGWGSMPADNSSLSISRTDQKPINSQNIHSLQVDVKGMSGGADRTMGLFNSGFFGMNLKKGLHYNLSFTIRAEDFQGPLSVLLSDSSGAKLSEPFILSDMGPEWKQFSVSMVANGNSDKGVLLFSPGSTGTFWLDMVSMFPEDTWDEGKSVFRADIMQNLNDYAPDFIRFPGGCLVHGVNVETMYHWKETIGDIAQRPGGWSKWRPNYRTDGLGYHEFCELCEYLGADAMYVAPTGLVCTGWVFQDGDTDNFLHPDVDVREYIQDCLDAIEYAIGPVDTQWGRLRAENGHPNPFPLKYVSIGNEDFGPRYYENYDAFYRAIRKKYPELKIITNSIIGRTADRDRKRERLSHFKDPSTIEIFDEHYYKDVPWVIGNYDKFDNYERPGPDLFIGELGIQGKHPVDILGEAVFMMMMERNADLNPMIADRPLMRNWTFVKGSGNPLYFHTNNMSWKTGNYYMSKMFHDNTQDFWYESVYRDVDGGRQISEESLFTSAGKDSGTGDIILKVVNLSDEIRMAEIRIGDKSLKSMTTVTTLTARNDQSNTPENPEAVMPQVQRVRIKFPSEYQFEPRSLTVFRMEVIN